MVTAQSQPSKSFINNNKSKALRTEFGGKNLLTNQRAVHLFAFLGLDLPQVELQLFAFQEVTVRPTALAGSGGDASCRRERETPSVMDKVLSTDS